MTKTINPDVAAFKEDFFKGLSFRECVFGASALLTGVGGILLLHFYFGVGINTAITLCMPVIGIIGLCGFYHKNGLTLAQLVRNDEKMRMDIERNTDSEKRLMGYITAIAESRDQ